MTSRKEIGLRAGRGGFEEISENLRTGEWVFNLLPSNRAETKQKARQARIGPAMILHLQFTPHL